MEEFTSSFLWLLVSKRPKAIDIICFAGVISTEAVTLIFLNFRTWIKLHMYCCIAGRQSVLVEVCWTRGKIFNTTVYIEQWIRITQIHSKIALLQDFTKTALLQDFTKMALLQDYSCLISCGIVVWAYPCLDIVCSLQWQLGIRFPLIGTLLFLIF